MNGRILGAILIVTGCGGFGFAITASYRKEETALRQLLAVLDYMQCELQYRLTPLPDLCHTAGTEHKNAVGAFFLALGEELESQISPDVGSCVHAAGTRAGTLPARVSKAFDILGTSLGRFDVEGQIRGLESVRAFVRSELELLASNRELRLRSYQTLSICAGAALAILFV